MGLLKFGWLKNGPAQIWVGSNLGRLKFGLAQIWVCSNLVRSNLAAQIWAAQKRLDTIPSVLQLILKSHFQKEFFVKGCKFSPHALVFVEV